MTTPTEDRNGYGNGRYTLIDDGTLDTVFVCGWCGREIRTNPATEDYSDAEDLTDLDKERIRDGLEIADEHECTDEAGNPYVEPGEIQLA